MLSLIRLRVVQRSWFGSETIVTQIPCPGGGRFLRGFLIPLFILAVASALVAPFWSLLPAYVEKSLGQPPTLTGVLFGTCIISSGILFLPGGAVADRIGSRRTLLLGFAGLGLSGLFFMVSSRPSLFMLSVAVGAGSAFHVTGSMSYLMRAVSTARLGVGTGVFFVSMTLGMSAGSFIFGLVADRWGYGPMGWIVVVGMLAIVLFGWFALPEVGSTAHEKLSVSELMRGYRSILGNTQVRWLLAVRFLPTSMWGAASVAFPYLLFIATGRNQTPGFYAATSLVGAAVAQFVTGKFCDRFGIPRTVRVVSVLIPITTLLTGIFSGSFVGFWICGILYTGAAWALSTTMPPLMNSVVGRTESGRIVGATHVAWAAGMAFGQISAGWLVTIDPAACYYVGTVLCSLSVYCAWRVTSK